MWLRKICLKQADFMIFSKGIQFINRESKCKGLVIFSRLSSAGVRLDGLNLFNNFSFVLL